MSLPRLVCAIESSVGESLKMCTDSARPHTVATVLECVLEYVHMPNHFACTRTRVPVCNNLIHVCVAIDHRTRVPADLSS